MLIIRGIEHPRGHQHHHRMGDLACRQRQEILVQQEGIVAHHPHPVGGEQVGEQALGHLPILKHVRHARRGPEVIFQDVVFSICIPDQVDPRDVNVDVVRRTDAMHLPRVLRAGGDQRGRDHAIFQDLLFAVDITEEKVQGLQPLPDACLDQVPFRSSDDPREDVEREDPLDAFVFAVNGEGDALAHEQLRGQLVFLVQVFGTKLPQGVKRMSIFRTDRSVGDHLVPKAGT